ncbi:MULTISPECIES: LuxR C-terminal-related transcriptional regulator [unclassified Clostridium]|uniref:LuxR C-terminal-related transcriptional regulator n=1 Tax=unclassified Clostridium TaxID=2614128 RepID=UPI000297903A|nr:MULTISPECIES: LuxR C-terminal-related transcriptional regulator [unclassified Clostridium]EKQ56763.1 MAG: ATP-dependent transcriptional regulator [Clostridium sp. Maddingley MBC34-26]
MKNILYTRLIRPKNKSYVLRRNQSIESKLNSILKNKLTLVKGGAAVGKSTLISSFIAEKENYMWFSLDENSDDLSYFWTYILHGLKNNIEDLNFYIDMINPLVKREDIFELILSLINELISEKELFIVLDDFHYLEDKFLMETIDYFISNSSDNVHFILISRYDIKIYLGNILMKGGIVDINSNDFNLTLKETEEFIKNISNVEIDGQVINDIYLITEGWIGAIKLLLTTIGNNKNIKNIPKDNKLFIDYMHNEVINSLSKDEIDFLVKTSPLSYVNPSIYKEISNKDGFEIIGNLIAKNMLIITIDEEKKIFRYHNILKQYLMKLFDKYDDVIKNQIIEKLNAFLISDSNYDEAISILINYSKYDDALKIIEKNAHNIVSTKILNEFPLEYYSKSIDLIFISIFYNYLSLDYERCNLIVNSIGDNASNNVLKSAIKLFALILNNSCVDDCYFELPKVIDNNLNIFTKTIYYILASWTLGFVGEASKALEMMELIKESNIELNNSYVDLLYEYNKVSILECMGKLNESLDGYKKLIERMNNKNYKSCFTIFRTVGLPGVYIKKLMHKEAEELLIEAQGMLKDFDGKAAFSSLKVGIDYNLAEVKYIQGDIDECERLLNNIQIEDKESYAYNQILALKIRLLSNENRVKKEEYDEFIHIYEKRYKNSTYSDNIGLTYGIILFHLGQYEESLQTFNKVAFVCRKNGVGYSLVYSLLWKVILLNKVNANNTRECVNILKEVVFYSKDEELLFPYYINRKYLKEIIKKFEAQLLNDRDNREFIKRLCELIGVKDEKEVLSSRELEVLKALIDGLSNKEIGEKLFISISTVKTHILNIYSKLGAKNRVEAVNEGRKVLLD